VRRCWFPDLGPPRAESGAGLAPGPPGYRRLVPLVKRSSLPRLPRIEPTTLELLGGWGEGFEDPGDAEAAVVYGQWADLLYIKIACLFGCAAVADLVVWAASGSVASLLGPGSVLILCMAYLYRRRRFRRRVRGGRSGAERPIDGTRSQPSVVRPLAQAGGSRA
jgi:hypothetical protein